MGTQVLYTYVHCFSLNSILNMSLLLSHYLQYLYPFVFAFKYMYKT